MFRSAKRLVISACGLFLLGAPAIAQAIDQGGATAAPTPLAAPQTENAPPAAPQTESDSAAAQQPAEIPPPNLGQGTKAQAEHSAEATAHKSVNDPNNQLGTSLQGRTRPVVEANGPPNTAPADTPAQAAAQ